MNLPTSTYYYDSLGLSKMRCFKAVRYSIFLPQFSIFKNIIFIAGSSSFFVVSGKKNCFPFFASVLKIWLILSACSLSRLEDGSSAIIISGSFISARAITVRRFSPPERVPGKLSDSFSSPS